MEKLITKSFRRLLDKGVHRGFITYEELSKSLGKRNSSHENIEKAFLHIFDHKVCLVEKKTDFKSTKKRESTSSESNKAADLDKSDDPIRMYLREMGGVELLSREGEIAIAKRIEAGKNVMITALLQSPITARKVFEWKEKLEKSEMLVREIIDIDSTYMDIESESVEEVSSKTKVNKTKVKNELDESEKNLKNKEENKEKEEENGEKGNKNEEYVEVDEFNPSLAAMEEEIKPQVISTINILSKNYRCFWLT